MTVLDMGAGGGYTHRADGARGRARPARSTRQDDEMRRAPRSASTRGMKTAGDEECRRAWRGRSTIRCRPTCSNLDLITFFFFYHDTTYMAVDRAAMNKKLFAALKPGGFLVIADHSAQDRARAPSVGKTLHRIEESDARAARSRPRASSWSRRATSCAIPKTPREENDLRRRRSRSTSSC